MGYEIFVTLCQRQHESSRNRRNKAARNDSRRTARRAGRARAARRRRARARRAAATTAAAADLLKVRVRLGCVGREREHLHVRVRRLGRLDLEVSVVDEEVRVPEEGHAEDHVEVPAVARRDRLEAADASLGAAAGGEAGVEHGVERVDRVVDTTELEGDADFTVAVHHPGGSKTGDVGVDGALDSREHTLGDCRRDLRD